MKNFIKFSTFFLSIFFAQNLLGEDFQAIYYYGTTNKNGYKQTVKIDNDSIFEIEGYKFAYGSDQSPSFKYSVKTFYLADCDDNKLITDQPKFTSSWDSKTASKKPVWEEVKGDKMKTIFNHICKYSNF